MAKGKITIDEFFCKGCGLCISVCPKEILVLNEAKVNLTGYNPCMVTDMEECIACGSCAKICPDVAITIEKFD